MRIVAAALAVVIAFASAAFAGPPPIGFTGPFPVATALCRSEAAIHQIIAAAERDHWRGASAAAETEAGCMLARVNRFRVVSVEDPVPFFAEGKVAQAWVIELDPGSGKPNVWLLYGEFVAQVGGRDI